MNGGADFLEDQLVFLATYGEPRLHLMKRGWYAVLEVDTRAPGTKLEYDSGFGHATPNDAVTAVMEQVRAALTGFHATVPPALMAGGSDE